MLACGWRLECCLARDAKYGIGDRTIMFEDRRRFLIWSDGVKCAVEKQTAFPLGNYLDRADPFDGDQQSPEVGTFLLGISLLTDT